MAFELLLKTSHSQQKFLLVPKILHASLNLITGKAAKRRYYIALSSATKITFLVLRWMYSIYKML